ncbi:M48 family metallopeptidase [Plastorhodobacter daqingensis]|uniref:M48 family metallopeptidase n=1 Tax=Plastorhodobacter daqingensis TaxID=1387281 RepID=A0ABW2UKK1_9RHOB
MDRALLPGNPPVEIALRRSAQTRRFSLRVSRLDGRVTLTVPQRARTGDALEFARAQEEWIRTTLAALPQRQLIGEGSLLPFEGRELVITQAPVRSPTVEAQRLLVPRSGAVGPRIAGFLKHAARDRLAQACDRHAARLGLGYSSLTLRDTRSRWGSCSSDGRLMFSWRLVMAPAGVLDYVAAHEVAHLSEMNHSPAFWAVVAGLCPDWRAQRIWLRSHGNRLHGFLFTSDA